MNNKTPAILLDSRNDGVFIITFNRPDKKNAFNREAWQGFSDGLIQAKADKNIACVLLTGAGDNFSSGMDLNDFGQGDDEGEHPFYLAQKTLIDFDKPIIAAAKGIAIGGGASILLHCDVLIIGHSLRMRFPFVSLGLVPEFAASYMLASIIGHRRASELLYSAKWLDADSVIAYQLATELVDDNAVFDVALAQAQAIAKWPVTALQETKRCIKSGHCDNLQQALSLEKQSMDKLVGGPDNIEAIMAFLEKRKPNFK